MKNSIFIISLLFVLNSNAQGRYDQPSGKVGQYESQYVPVNTDLYERIAREKHDKQQKETSNSILKLKELYLNAPNYPTAISDGFHNVEITDNLTELFTVEVYVSENKITHFSINKTLSDKVSFSSNIIKGKSLIKIMDSGYLNAYFIEDIYK